MRAILRHLRRAGIFVVGMFVLIIGIILIPLPGPGILVMISGLAILAIEFEWAHRHKTRLQTHFNKLLERSLKKNKKN